MTITLDDSICRHIPHSVELHEFIFSESSRRAVDIWFAHMGRFIEDIPSGGKVRLLLDVSRSGHQPLSYVSERARQFNVEHPRHPKSRVAILYHTHILMSVFIAFDNLINNGNYLKHFRPDQREQALLWLMEN